LFWSPYVDKDDIVVAVDEGRHVDRFGGNMGRMGEVDKDAYTSGATVVKNQVKVEKRSVWW